MATNPTITFSLDSSFPEGWCFENWQQHAAQLISMMTGYLPGNFSGVIISDTEPEVADRDKVWLKLSSNYPVRWYYYAGGSWVWPHPVPPSGSERRLWVGDTSTLETYDGGASGTVTNTTGPMWTVDSDFDAKFLIGVGTLPSGTPITVGGEGGTETVTLTAAQLPTHTHDFTVNTYVSSDDATSSPDGEILMAGRNHTVQDITPDVTVDGGGSGEAHSNMPPYRGIYLIKRTARIYWTA